MRKSAVVLIAVSVLVLAGGGYGGWIMYGRHQLNQSVAPHVKNTTLRLQDALQLEITPTAMTYAELFSKLDENVKEVDRRLLEIRSMDTSAHPQLAIAAEAYMKASQEVFRQQASAYRHQLALTSAQDWYTKMMRDYEGSEFERRQRRKDLADVAEKARESAVSLIGYGLSLLGFEKTVAEVGPNFDQAIILSSDLPKKVRGSVDKRVSVVEEVVKRTSESR